MAVVGVGVAPVGVGFGGATPPKERISDDRSGTGRAHRGIGIRAGSGRRNFGMPQCSRSFSPGRMASASAAKIPRSRRAGAHQAAGGFDTDLPRRAGAIRGFSGGGRAYRRQKSVPGRAPRGRRRPNPDTIRAGSVTAPRSRTRGTSVAYPHSAGSPTLPDSRQPASEVYAPRRGVPFRFHRPGNLRPSTRHRNLHRPTHTDINKTASQQNYTTTQQHNNKTKQLGNRRP